MQVLETKGLSRWHGEVIAVNDLSVTVEPGITGLLGPNGAGKSSLLRMAVGLQKPSSGTIRVLGEDPWDNPGLLRRIGYVPEAPPPWRDVSGRQCLARAARLTGMQGAEQASAVERALDRVGLGEAAGKRVGAYSHGMQQRIKLALALLHDPELYVLDEPLSATDPLARRDLIHLLRQLADEGKSILISTHVLPDIEALTQRILLLHRGRKMAYGDVHQIRDLLDRYPRTVRVATPEPRELGAILWKWDSVLSVEADARAVTVRTDRPARFYEELQDLLAQGEVPFESVTSPDDNVEAVFRYLVG